MDKVKKIILLIVAMYPPLLTESLCDDMERQKYYPVEDSLVLRKISSWKDKKFGMFIHWGTYSQWGIIESWSICGEDEEWIKRFRNNDDYEEYKKDYENLQNTFNPQDFNPKKWAKAAKRAGMKYVVFTTKHHDGFAMFDTKFSDYKITSPKTPFHTDKRANIAKEVFSAFSNEDFMIGAYFSKPDWHSPYYWSPDNATPDRNPNYIIKNYPERWEKFVSYTHNQIDELMSDYGKIDILWLDGGWVQPYTERELWAFRTMENFKQVNLQSQDIRMREIAESSRKKQPGLIVVDRAVEGRYQNYVTPENRVPDDVILVPWESCLTASEDGWSWRKTPSYKTAREVIHTLADIVAKGGNLLLNFAPSPKGDLDKEAYDLMDEIGRWMDVNNEAIYFTRPVKPYKEGKLALTQSEKTGCVYAIYLADENEESMPSKIWLSCHCPGKNGKVALLGTDKELKWEKVDKGFIATIPDELRKNPPSNNAWVLKIQK